MGYASKSQQRKAGENPGTSCLIMFVFEALLMALYHMHTDIDLNMHR